MLDLKVVRQDPDRARQGAIKKHFPDRAEAVDRLIAVDEELRALIPRIDGLRSEQKQAGKSIGSLSEDERAAHFEAQKKLKLEIQELEQQERTLKERLQQELLLIPNIPDEGVPEGKDDLANVEVRTWGERPAFDFEPKAHYELAEQHGWIDFERAADMAGSRNYMLFGELAALHDAVLRLALDHMIAKGFVQVEPPLLVRDSVMTGTGFFPGGEEQTYRCERDELNLIGTAEVPVTSIHAGEILAESDLPKLYVARSVCFRREAGTYGKDTRGLYRVHQFQKVEQVVVDVADEAKSRAHHEAIVENSEQVLQALELPYRVVNVCGGDLGVPQAFKYDIECWMPSREAYGETHSASRFYDYQARRLNLRYRRADNKKTAHCHTLNNTVIASPRILIPLLEIHQQADGSIRVPAALQPYLGGTNVLPRIR
ncbi:MAG: serine--tRNA ligase [Planctomycetes bacterium]|nr:serine--tRNA ligase [Planctomycetota bacterium]